MSWPIHQARRLIPSLLRRKPWPPSTATPPVLNEPDKLVEEEKSPYYHRDHFYPAHLGDVLHARYQLATKLGYGSSSTVWLARDLARLRWQEDRYVALKVNTSSDARPRNAAANEHTMLKRIRDTNAGHRGWSFVRQMLDSFDLEGVSSAKHLCFVFQPLREPLWRYARRFPGDVVPLVLLKVIIRQILEGLVYLHSECHIIHTDLKPDNILVAAENPSIFAREAEREYTDPFPRKHTSEGRTIYLSRSNYGPPSRPIGLIEITDFGLSVSGDSPNSGAIQAEVYRAPEVILDAGYSYAADLWNLGAMLWDLLEGKALFDDADPSADNTAYQDDVHLALITALLGPAPRDLLEKGERTSMFYDADGNLRNPSSIPKDFTLESSITKMNGRQKEMFVTFVKRMLTWRPEERSTASELLADPWLHDGEE